MHYSNMPSRNLGLIQLFFRHHFFYRIVIWEEGCVRNLCHDKCLREEGNRLFKSIISLSYNQKCLFPLQRKAKMNETLKIRIERNRKQSNIFKLFHNMEIKMCFTVPAAKFDRGQQNHKPIVTRYSRPIVPKKVHQSTG